MKYSIMLILFIVGCSQPLVTIHIDKSNVKLIQELNKKDKRWLKK